MDIAQTETGDQEISPVIKRRKPIVAFFLSLLFPGLGQTYNGQLKKGILFFILSFLIQVLFCRTIGVSTFMLASIFALLGVSFRIYAIIDAVRNAKKQKEYVLKRYNTAVHYIVFAIIITASAFYFDFPAATGYQGFSIPSTGNNPTLQVGDVLMTDMEAYKNTKPTYGDFATFKKDDGMNYVYRVVGLPGDKIELEGNLLIINGKRCESNLTRSFMSDEGPYRMSDEGRQVMTKISAEEWEEVLPNGHKHLIQRFIPSPDSAMANVKNIIVPAGSYFLLGDNRGNAMDSRYIGFIKEEDLEGKILYSYWGNSMERININFLGK